MAKKSHLSVLLRAAATSFSAWVHMRNQDKKLEYQRELDQVRQKNLESRWKVEDSRHAESIAAQKEQTEFTKEVHEDNVRLKEDALNFSQSQEEINAAKSLVTQQEKMASTAKSKLQARFDKATEYMDKSSDEYQKAEEMHREAISSVNDRFIKNTEMERSVLVKHGYLKDESTTEESLVSPPGNEQPKVVTERVLPQEFTSVLNGLGYDSMEEAEAVAAQKREKEKNYSDVSNHFLNSFEKNKKSLLAKPF